MVKRGRIVAFFLILVLFGSLAGTTTNGILNDIKLGLDLQGGFEVLYDVTAIDKGQKIDKTVLSHTVSALNKRVNVIGVSEPNITIEGDNRIRVQLAGVTDQNEARRLLATEATLTFRDVNDEVLMDGSDLAEGGAKQTFDENGKPSVSIKLKSANKFKEVTQKIVNMGEPNNILAIWLDFEEGVDSYKTAAGTENEHLVSYPRVSQIFNQDTVSIVGNFSIEEATELSDLLNAGSLPVKLTEVYSTSVGAQFGEQALQKTILGGIIGIAVIFLFMLVYYRFPGFIATVTLSIYIFLILVIFDWMNGVLTLPGIAALILGVGMAVDANIITYERIKEEIRVGRTIKSAFQAGSKNSFTSIFDANITTILVAGVLFYFGTSSVKGFATMLIISILVSFLTAVYGSRILLGLWVNSNLFNKKPSWFGVKESAIHDIAENKDAHDLKTKFDRFDFVKPRKIYYLISVAITVIGIVIVSIFGLNLGIDFTQGTRIDIMSNHQLTKEEVQSELASLNIETNDIVISGEENNVGAVRLKEVLTKDEIADLKAHFLEKNGTEPSVSTVSPTVGRELALNALKALGIASIGIILYVSVRFEMRMAVPAVVALLHDAFIIIMFFSITRLEVDITFIAAVLTVVGYSINDTIVTFDRMRENMQKKKRLKSFDDIADVTNTALRQVMSRSINTVLTVIFAILGLLIFGSESIRNFSIALLIGTIVGVYSSIFLAAQMWADWKGKELREKGVLKTEKVKRKSSDEPQV